MRTVCRKAHDGAADVIHAMRNPPTHQSASPPDLNHAVREPVQLVALVAVSDSGQGFAEAVRSSPDSLDALALDSRRLLHSTPRRAGAPGAEPSTRCADVVVGPRQRGEPPERTSKPRVLRPRMLRIVRPLRLQGRRVPWSDGEHRPAWPVCHYRGSPAITREGMPCPTADPNSPGRRPSLLRPAGPTARSADRAQLPHASGQHWIGCGALLLALALVATVLVVSRRLAGPHLAWSGPYQPARSSEFNQPGHEASDLVGSWLTGTAIVRGQPD